MPTTIDPGDLLDIESEARLEANATQIFLGECHNCVRLKKEVDRLRRVLAQKHEVIDDLQRDVIHYRSERDYYQGKGQ